MEYIITNPTLPPLIGYVEVIDENGNHIYKPTAETVSEQSKETRTKNLETTVGSILCQSNPIELNKAIQLFVNSLSDEATAMAVATVYPEYQVGVSYKIGDKFRYGANSVGDPQLYQVLQDHTSASEWTPDNAASLYKKIGVSEDGTPIWVQPLGATDAYNIGDQVIYNGKKYESVINANVWAPDVYPTGWKLVEDTVEPSPEPEPEPEPGGGDTSETVPEFVQPTGAHDAYNTGDRVKFTDGHIYESLMNSNIWSPTAYPAGWKLIE